MFPRFPMRRDNSNLTDLSTRDPSGNACTFVKARLHSPPACNCVTSAMALVCHRDWWTAFANRPFNLSCRILEPLQTTRSHALKQTDRERGVLTTKLLFTFSKMRFSFSAIASPFRFLTRFFSSFLQAYILPVARTWQAQTWKTSKRGNATTWTNLLWSATNGSCNVPGRRFLLSAGP